MPAKTNKVFFNGTSDDVSVIFHGVINAGKIARFFFGASPEMLGIEIKPDQSLLTIADTSIQAALIEYFTQRLWPSAGMVSFLAEEKKCPPIKPSTRSVIIIDPIDGTKQFVSERPDYAIAVALADNTPQGLRVTGSVTLQPETEILTLSHESGSASYDLRRNTKKALDLSKIAARKVVCLWGDVRDEVDGAVLAYMMRDLGKRGYETRMIGSCVLMNAGVAAGQFDGEIIYSGQSIWAHPWDIASAHQIVQAGGAISTLDGRPDPLNDDPHALIAGRDPSMQDMLLECTARARQAVSAPPLPNRSLLTRFPTLKYIS